MLFAEAPVVCGCLLESCHYGRRLEQSACQGHATLVVAWCRIHMPLLLAGHCDYASRGILQILQTPTIQRQVRGRPQTPCPVLVTGSRVQRQCLRLIRCCVGSHAALHCDSTHIYTFPKRPHVFRLMQLNKVCIMQSSSVELSTYHLQGYARNGTYLGRR